MLRGTVRHAAAVWRRNFLAWRKSAAPSVLGSFMEPLLYLLTLGYGLGRFVGAVDGAPYVNFLMAGILATSAMNTATFEGLYLAYTRMAVLRTWEGMLAAPLSVRDIVFGELLWMGSKATFSVTAILLVMSSLGHISSWQALWVVPLGFLNGITFGAMALVVTSFARSYDFFVYYVTLVVTPMILLSGVFFPSESLPTVIYYGAGVFPLQHMVALIRPLVLGYDSDWSIFVHLAVPLLFALGATSWAIRRLERRLLR